MRIRKLPNGNLVVPKRAEAPDGTIGDGMVEIGPEDPEYAAFLSDLERQEKLDADPRNQRGSD